MGRRKKQEINLSVKKKVTEGLWKRNLGKGISCMVRLCKIEYICYRGFKNKLCDQ